MPSQSRATLGSKVVFGRTAVHPKRRQLVRVNPCALRALQRRRVVLEVGQLQRDFLVFVVE